MEILDCFERWRIAVYRRLEIAANARTTFPTLAELIDVLPRDFQSIEEDYAASVLLLLALRLHSYLKKEDLFIELLNENLDHLELMEKLAQVVLFSPATISLCPRHRLLTWFPGHCRYTDSGYELIRTAVISLLRGAWKMESLENNDWTISYLECTIDSSLLAFWNNGDSIPSKLSSLRLLLNSTLETNAMADLCAKYGLSVTKKTRLVELPRPCEEVEIIPASRALSYHYYGEEASLPQT